MFSNLVLDHEHSNANAAAVSGWKIFPEHLCVRLKPLRVDDFPGPLRVFF